MDSSRRLPTIDTKHQEEVVTIPPGSPNPVGTVDSPKHEANDETIGFQAFTFSSAGTFGDYDLLHEIARGGMGIVYKARQRHLNRTVALKMIAGGKLASHEEVQRFYSEAEAAANLDHSGIVPIYEVGQAEGQHFFSMAFVEGQSLAARVADGPLPPEEACAMMLKITRAIGFAHQRGIIHRDLKPANVLLDCNGEPKVTDFGLAKRYEEESGLTHTGAVLGTPSYMPPEQANGQTSKVGPAADIYSLGAILYCLLTGRPPFQAATPLDTMLQVLERDPVPLRQLNPKVPRDLETISLKCLEKQPTRRYSSAAALAEELECYLEGRPISARPISWLEQGQRWCRRKPVVAGLSLSLAIVLLSLAIGGPYIAWRQAHLLGELRTAQRQRTEALVESLTVVSAPAIPAVLSGIAQDFEVALPKLQELHASQVMSDAQRARLELSLLSTESRFLPTLSDYLLNAPAEEFPIYRELLAGHGSELRHKYWELAINHDGRPSKNILRAAGALAIYDPDSPKWPLAAEHVADVLCREPPLSAGVWVESLSPVKQHFYQPLARLAEDRRTAMAARRLQATAVLTQYRADNVEELVQLLSTSDEQQFEIVFSTLQGNPEALPSIRRELERLLSESAADSSPRANLALAALRLGNPSSVNGLLEQSADPELRNSIIVRAARQGVPVSIFESQLSNQNSDGIRQALVLAIGHYSSSTLPAENRARVTQLLEDWATSAEDPGLRSASQWTLSRWKVPIQQSLESRSKQQRWHINSRGCLMVALPLKKVFLGSPSDEQGRRDDEVQSPFDLDYKLAIAATEVTVSHFREFTKANPDVKHSFIRAYSPEDDCPQTSVTWHEAVAYCNWLNEVEGIPQDQWCYERVDSSSDLRFQVTPGFSAKSGYRLPTSLEWEYACRAATRSVRSYGDDPELMAEFAWYQGNALDRSWPVATKMPNDWGLFDMHGNVWEWCHDAPEADAREQLGDSARTLRGGSFFYHPIYIRSALRNRELSASRFYGIGFRYVRRLGGG